MVPESSHMAQITAGKFARRDPVNKGTEQENKNPVREPGNVVVEEGGNASIHQRDSESVELPFDLVDE